MDNKKLKIIVELFSKGFDWDEDMPKIKANDPDLYDAIIELCDSLGEKPKKPTVH